MIFFFCVLISSTRFGAYGYPRDESLSSLYLNFAVDSDSVLARIAEGMFLLKGVGLT